MEAKELWKEALKLLESEIAALSFDVWVKTLCTVCIFNNKLVLAAKTNSHRNLVEGKYQEQIVTAVQQVFPRLNGVDIITEDQKELFVAKADEEETTTKETESENMFVTKYTFDNFVVGKSNEFVAAAAKAVSEAPGQKYNPLFIYGGVGLGKTHLMHAIGNHLRKTMPKIKAKYVSCERFTNELIESIRDSKNQNSKQAFRKKYRNVDILMIDDIQFISKTVSTQEELFHTFNDLFQSGKQIIISSDRPPKEISPLEERLRTRFEGGLIADVQPPDLETRIAILQKKAMQEKYNISNEVLTIIAARVKTNIREMEGLLTKVISYAPLINKSINDMEVVQEALKDYGEDKMEVVNVETVIDCVTSYFNLERAQLIGKKKNKEIVEPRQICIYLITELLTLPLTAIGQIFGGRDHTTIMHARDKICDMTKENKRISIYVKDLMDMIMKK